MYFIRPTKSPSRDHPGVGLMFRLTIAKCWWPIDQLAVFDANPALVVSNGGDSARYPRRRAAVDDATTMRW
jgi:hypothetical protein